MIVKLINACSYRANLGKFVMNQCSARPFSVKIDNVKLEKSEKKLKNHEEFVPKKFYDFNKDGSAKIPQTSLHHLRWIMQKDNLKQDLFLIGRPGSYKRSLAMTYLQLTGQECEYIALSRDTTESDMKQRREILNGTSIFLDQPAVRAAREGRILILEGVEKAERNILPILNNLLENREMHLENGMFMISAERYDKLLKENSQEVLDKMGLVRVSENFRVIALGLPVPKYRGAPLDPPLRSRFQARDVTTLSYHEMFSQLQEQNPAAPAEVLKKILSFGFAVSSANDTTLPDFPLDSIFELGKLLEANPNIPEYDLINRIYPASTILALNQKESIKTLMDSLNIEIPKKASKQSIVEVEHKTNETEVTIKLANNSEAVLKIPVNSENALTTGSMNKFIKIDYQTSLIADMMQTYSVSDFCLVGPRGSGKSALIIEMCKTLNQPMEQMTLYKDMSTRDLIQNRTTNATGDTGWKDSALVKACKNGSVVVLDGLHRLHSSTISILHRLVHDRELQLYDGTRLLRADKYDELITNNGMTINELTEKGVLRIHPAFRIIALAEPPQLDATGNWLSPEILSLFLFHENRNLNKSEEIQIIQELYGKVHPSMEKILNFAQSLRESSTKDPILKNFAETLSTRQLLRIANRLARYSGTSSEISIYDTIQRIFLAKFLPALPRDVLESALKKHEIQPLKKRSKERTIEVDTKKNLLKIGGTETEIMVNDLSSSLKVPEILFYDTPQNTEVLELLLQDFLLGYHLLLVGNQGVGKNKLADRLLQLMNRPREYIQLHRDTTVQSLTIQPSIVDGKVIFEDSPLVKAVKNGYVLVIDEADKAPTNVTCVLKSLVENGEMTLSDNRRIVPYDPKATSKDTENLIHTHPDFRIVVLANRPGFPFLGNDFFASLGHLFSCHSVDNPNPESEIKLLTSYGPNVDKKTIKKLVNAFAELRSMADVSQISYPYSTREVVNIVKHLEKYPDEDVSELVGNVLDFDRYAPESLEQVTSVLMKHGLAIESYAKNELAEVRRQKEMQLTVESTSGKDVSSPKHGKVDPNNDPHVGGNTWAGGSGGRDTAGLGGKGGPYRLDAGHKVHQLSDAEKDDIPEEVKAAARAMNRKAFDEKLKEIQMSKHDHSLYEQFRNPVKPHVNTLRNILNSLEAKAKERHWQKHQTSGELDDMKLIEGIAGEKSIYKMRNDQDPEPGQPQEKPKRLTLVVDVSGSMYRFNGYDGRMDRQLEALVMIMESFVGFESKIQYNVVGHSGESPCIPFIDHKNPPDNDKRRMETLKMMYAHSQYCWSGDNTLLATKIAVDDMAKEEADEAIVVVLSDANLSRYNISPKRLTDMLAKQEPKVQGFIIFIGSLGEEAEM